MKQLLLIAHTPSENTLSLRDSILKGCQHPDIDNIKTTPKSPFETQPDDVLNCDAVILFTTENFGYMSGALKDFFDRCYYPCLDHSQGLPYALVIRAGMDGTGTKIAVQKIITGLKWKQIQEPLICKGQFEPVFSEHCEELGMTVSAGLGNNLF